MKNKSLQRLAVSMCAIATLTVFNGRAEDSAGTGPQTVSAEDQLIQQAHYWEGRDRYDLARESWEKLLRTSSDNPAALSGLAMAEAKGGRSAVAQVYLDRLKQSHPDSPSIPRIEEAIRQGSFDQDRLTTPRSLAREGKYDDAVVAYRKVFGNEIPAGHLGLEYYQTLAGTKNGWSEARDGLEKLAQQNPNDPSYSLALGQHLTYREETRRQGISHIEKVSSDRQLGESARKSWRQALIWLGGKSGDEALYQDYLTKYGDDEEVSHKLALIRESHAVAGAGAVGPRAQSSDVLTPGEIHGQEVKAAFEFLNKNDLDDAESRFQQLLSRNPNDADSLGGLGILRLRQERYAEARDYLSRATRSSPGTSGRWREALASASFWEDVQKATAARQAGDIVTAERDLRTAINTYPQQASREPSVEASLADILVQENRTQEAEGIYRHLLQARPDSTDAARGLIGVLASTDRLPEALAIANRFPEDQRSKLGSIGSLKAQYLRNQAEKATAAGDEVRAEGLLKDALLLDPENPFTRLDLAHIYQHENRAPEANTLIDGVLVSNPDMPDALFVKAILQADQQAWYDGLQTMEQIPPASRTPAMGVLQRRLWVRYQTQRASLLAKQGYPHQAAAILAQVEPQAGDTPENLGAMAIAYADSGDDGRALRYIREVIARQAKPDPGLRLVYAGLLFKLNQDAEFEVVMEELLRNGGLTDEQNLDLANLRIGYRLRQADAVREQGDLGRAYDYLEPLLRMNPNDPRVLMALARLYDDSKDYDRSLQIYQRVLANDPDNLDALKGGAGAAVSLKKYDTADDMVAHASKLDPDNPKIYALAGRVARAEGDDGKALKLYQQALKLDSQTSSGPEAVGGGAPQLQLLDPGRDYFDRAAPQAALAPTAFHVSRNAIGSAPRLIPATLAAGGKPMFRGWGISPYLASYRGTQNAPFVTASHGRSVDSHLRKVSVSAGSSEQDTSDPYWQRPSKVVIAGDCAPAHKQTQVRRDGCAPRTKLARTHKKKRSAYERPLAPEPFTSRSTPLPDPYVYGQPTPIYKVPRDGYAGAPASGNYTPAPVVVAPQSDYLPPVAPPSSAPIIRTEPLPASQGLVLDRRRAQDTNERDALQQQIEELQSSNSGYVGGGLSGRTRDGVSGLGRLSDIEVPVEAAIATGQSGRLSFRAVPVYLDSGTLSGSNLAQFGALALVSNPSLRYSENDAGVAVGIGYDNSSLHLDIGSSPIGMSVVNLIGGISWAPTFGRTSLKIDLSRRSVTDSLLSYAGAYDPATGRTWGGVTRSGGRLDLSYDLGRYGIYANAGYHVYDGQNVEQNQSVEAGAGFYIHAIERPSLKLTYGLNVTTFFYDRNLSYYSFGHGGYFSPQQYYSVGIPVVLQGGNRRLSYQVGGSLGLQAFKADGAALFPNDSGLQNEANLFAVANPGTALGYGSRNSSGVGFQFGGSLEYLLDRNLSLGGQVGVDNANDYNEAYASGYIRYWFSPQTKVSTPPTQILPYYDYDRGHPNR